MILYFHSPSPGIYAVITVPLLKRTLATFLSPELGFFGFVVPTLRHTPFSSGLLTMAGDLALLAFCPFLHPRRTWLYVASAGGVEENARWIKEGCGAKAVVRRDRDGAGRRRKAPNIRDAILAGCRSGWRWDGDAMES
jgi:hypothetical protein